MRLRIRPAKPADLRYIGRRLRPADRVELGLADGEDGTPVLFESAAGARWVHVARIGNEPVVVYGVNPSTSNPRWGVPWLLATPHASRLSRAFARFAPAEVDLMHAAFPFLHNRVHGRHHAAIEWLMRLGFVIDFERPDGDFLNFWRGNPYV